MARKKFMSAAQFTEIAIEVFGSVEAAGRFLRAGLRTGYRYANDESRVPAATADLMNLLKAKKITPDDVVKHRKSR